ncbi:glycosyltransferase family 87 protein [Rhizobium sp. YIM 134829]|uniref:glycosyltransferase family 87 protein n=1 Tax=Rhizobium sp. YIM 134829 TaxID=3390453 RepID=UPI0039787B30
MRNRTDMRIAAATALVGLMLAALYQIRLWTIGPDGYSLLSGRLPYWDFSNLWAGGRLAVEGRVDAIFDPEIYRAALRAWFGSGLPDQEWSYPPSILLIGVPLSLLPLPLAYGIWTFGTLACLYAMLRLFALPPLVTVALLVSPGALATSLFGQNGSLTAALLLGALILLPTRPILAGVLAGLLTIKPHLGLLLPLCFLVSGQYRAIAAAAVTGAAMALLTGLFWGFEVWSAFFTKTGPLMTAILEAEFPQGYQVNAMTVFILARALGLSLGWAYLCQAMAFTAAALACIWIWRPCFAMDHRQRACLTAVLTLIATPYGYSYDAVPLSVAAACFFLTDPRLPRPLLALTYLWPLILHIPNRQGLMIAVLVPILFVGMVLWSRRTAPVPQSVVVEGRGAIPSGAEA